MRVAVILVLVCAALAHAQGVRGGSMLEAAAKDLQDKIAAQQHAKPGIATNTPTSPQPAPHPPTTQAPEKNNHNPEHHPSPRLPPFEHATPSRAARIPHQYPHGVYRHHHQQHPVAPVTHPVTEQPHTELPAVQPHHDLQTQPVHEPSLPATHQPANEPQAWMLMFRGRCDNATVPHPSCKGKCTSQDIRSVIHSREGVKMTVRHMIGGIGTLHFIDMTATETSWSGEANVTLGWHLKKPQGLFLKTPVEGMLRTLDDGTRHLSGAFEVHGGKELYENSTGAVTINIVQSPDLTFKAYLTGVIFNAHPAPEYAPVPGQAPGAPHAVPTPSPPTASHPPQPSHPPLPKESKMEPAFDGSLAKEIETKKALEHVHWKARLLPADKEAHIGNDAVHPEAK